MIYNLLFEALQHDDKTVLIHDIVMLSIDK